MEKDPNLKTVEKDPDSFYLRAMARSAVPPDGFDRVEFLLKYVLQWTYSLTIKEVYFGTLVSRKKNEHRSVNIWEIRICPVTQNFRKLNLTAWSF